ncbi:MULTISPECIES: helix-turn-helix domain-containing protein [Catenovulum]|uniref:Helix-turn-helix transcriptional regulator n=1 Tax=Catenovulum sediminis TaxID=1740262 RepID=A0ABV1RK27_9ALTE|nr:helix-turn-helix transcriptional regulator [Catenovulum sp. 2E275]MCU4676187.1 helix-turn-helix domain-containing protein [Catenovulum sp. 2E275]
MKDLAKKLGANIRVKRKEVGLAQDKLAELADMDRSYIGRIERGEMNITVEKLYSLAIVLKCKPKDLLP